MSDLENYENELLALDERISRLSLVCGVDINIDENIVSLIKGNFSICKKANDHTARELRGLLMLKYNIEEHCVEELGADKCLTIINDIHEKMKHEGFSPNKLD